jgi:histidinol-phosphate/aromatic aminotransferase/cobyric acid decarboxylase-like protein
MLENPELVAMYANQVAEGARFLQDSLTTFGVRWHGGHVTNGILVFLPDNLAVNQCIQYLRDHRIYVRGDFEPPYDCCFRVTIGPKETMEIFSSRFKDWYFQKFKTSMHESKLI